MPEKGRALDLGCAVGRSTFELARHFDQVVGIDFSQSFVDAANRMKSSGKHIATRLDEGNSLTELDLYVDTMIDRSRVFFEQGDAQWIREDIGEFDLVIGCNLICRLEEQTIAEEIARIGESGWAALHYNTVYLARGVYSIEKLAWKRCAGFFRGIA